MTLEDFLNAEHEKALADPMVTKHISPYHAWQGKQSEAPLLCNDAAQLAALRASNMQKPHIAPSDDLISRGAAIALVEAECDRILSKQDGKIAAVDMNLRFMAVMLPDIADAIRALPGHGQPAAHAVKVKALNALFAAAIAEADKAMRKFPQPNYVISKVAEEAGEVVKAAIHCAEVREAPEAVISEIRQAMAMLIRLYLEGDQVHGLPPLSALEITP